MEKLEIVIHCLAGIVICVGIGMLLEPTDSKYVMGVQSSLGILVIFLGSLLIFIRNVFKINYEKPKNGDVAKQ